MNKIRNRNKIQATNSYDEFIKKDKIHKKHSRFHVFWTLLLFGFICC